MDIFDNTIPVCSLNWISGVMVGVLYLSVVDRGIEPVGSNQTIKLIFAASSLNTQI